jgi:hypothetical protein
MTEAEYAAIPAAQKYEEDGRLWVLTPFNGGLCPVPVQIVDGPLFAVEVDGQRSGRMSRHDVLNHFRSAQAAGVTTTIRSLDGRQDAIDAIERACGE